VCDARLDQCISQATAQNAIDRRFLGVGRLVFDPIAIIADAGINLPVLYGLGFSCNNCIPCVKATSPAYWALVRKHFPAEFARMTELSHRLDVRLTRLEGERAFIDDIPADHPMSDPIQPACDFLCHIAEQDLEAAE